MSEVNIHKVLNTEEFREEYISDVSALLKCTPAEEQVIYELFKYLGLNNELFLTSPRRQEIANTTNLRITTVNMIISSFYKKEILIKEDKRIYLNPKLFGIYEDDTINTKPNRLVSFIIQYEILENNNGEQYSKNGN